MALPDPEDIKTWLEWAGGKLLSLPLPSAAPAGYRTARIEYVQDLQAYGYTAETLRAPAVRPEEVAIMDQILLWPALASEIRVRRILHLRLLVTPVAGRHLHPLAKIARALHTSPQRVHQLHEKGLQELTFRVPRAQIHTIRLFFKSQYFSP